MNFNIRQWTIDEHGNLFDFRYQYLGLSGLFDPQWHRLVIFDSKVELWILQQPKSLWHLDDNHLYNQEIYLHPTLYTLFELRWAP